MKAQIKKDFKEKGIKVTFTQNEKALSDIKAPHIRALNDVPLKRAITIYDLYQSDNLNNEVLVYYKLNSELKHVYTLENLSDGQTLTESEINALKRFLDKDDCKYLNPSRLKINLTKRHSEKGFNYLWNLHFTESGKPRKSKDIFLKSSELYFLEQFDKFTLYGFNYDDRGVLSPVYTIHAKNGDKLIYIASFTGYNEVLRVEKSAQFLQHKI